MPTITDDIGVWNDLGLVTPNRSNWVKFPITATGANATFRVSCLCSDWNKINSFAWLRARYQTSNSNQVSQSIRIYPHLDSQLIEFPIPQDLQDRSIYFRDFEVKKALKYRRYIGLSPDINWQMKLEEIWG